MSQEQATQRNELFNNSEEISKCSLLNKFIKIYSAPVFLDDIIKKGFSQALNSKIKIF